MSSHRAVPAVAVGQIWANNDSASKGRTLRVEAIVSKLVAGGARVQYAVCRILTEPDSRAAFLGSPHYRATVGRIARIRVDRMKPTSTGYRFISHPQE